MTKTAIATEAPEPEKREFKPDDQALFLQVGNVPVVWLSQEDHPKYLEWRDQ